MAITRVNSSAIGAAGTTASAYSTTLGVAVTAGDVIVVSMSSNGTHAADGMSVQDSVNAVNFTTIKEQQGGSSSSRWLQTFVYQTPVDLASGTSITATPYAANTSSSFAVDVFRGADDVTEKAATSASGGVATSAAAPALGAAPTAGTLVLTFDQCASGTLTAGTPFTTGSTRTTGPSTGIGYVLSADGSSTYASTWTQGTGNTWAAETYALQALAVVAATMFPRRQFPQLRR